MKVNKKGTIPPDDVFPDKKGPPDIASKEVQRKHKLDLQRFCKLQMMSKNGKETTNHFAQFRDCLNQSIPSPPKKKRMRSSSTSESSEEDKVFNFHHKIMTDKDIQVFFQEQIMSYQYIIENDRCLQEHCLKTQDSSLLTYQEKLRLNRKGYQPMFKSITREKRDHLTKKRDEGPPLAHYTLNYTAVEKSSRVPIIKSQPQSKEKFVNQQMLCGKMVYSMYNQQQLQDKYVRQIEANAPRKHSETRNQALADTNLEIFQPKVINLNSSLDKGLDANKQQFDSETFCKRSGQFSYKNVKISNNHHIVQDKIWKDQKLKENNYFPVSIEINNVSLPQTAGGPRLQKFGCVDRSDQTGNRNTLKIPKMTTFRIKQAQTKSRSMNNSQIIQPKPKSQPKPYTLMGKKLKVEKSIYKKQMERQNEFLNTIELKIELDKKPNIPMVSPQKFTRSQIKQYSKDLEEIQNLIETQNTEEADCSSQKPQPKILIQEPQEEPSINEEEQKQTRTAPRRRTKSTLCMTPQPFPLASQTHQIDQMLDFKLDLISQQNQVLRSFDFKRKKKERFTQIDELLKQNQS